ncbi:TrkA C-terminal domain-containing protein [Salinispira pacifica]
MAEVSVPKRLLGKSLIEADLRRNHKVNAIAVSRGGREEYEFVSPAYVFAEEDVLLLVGREEDISQFSNTAIRGKGRRDFRSFMRRFLGRSVEREEPPQSPTISD